MTLYARLPKKQQRIIEQEVKFILSDNGVILPQTREDLKKCKVPFGTTLRYKNRDFYLTINAEESFKRINTLLIETKYKVSFLSINDYFRTTQKVFNKYFNEDVIPDARLFIDTIDKYLLELINEYSYVSKIDGLELKDLQELKIGSKVIKYFEPKIVPSYSKEKRQLRKIIVSIKKEYKKQLIIIGKEIGSESKSEKKFFENSNLVIVVLRIYSFILFKNSISSIGMGLITDYGGYRGNPTSFNWCNNIEDSLSYQMHNNGKTHRLEINAKTWMEISTNYKLNELAALIEKENKNELEETIIKALYWLGEAQKDNTLASSWIKLWTSLECFFSINKKDVTKSNVNGITVFLTIGHYVIDEFSDYKKVKNKIKKFYDKRSKIVHRSEYNHIEYSELTELSYIVSFVIINAMILIEKGYTKLHEIKREIDRLSILEESNSSKTILEDEFLVFYENYEYSKVKYDKDGTEYIEINENIENILGPDERNYIFRNTLSISDLDENKYFRTTKKVNPEYFI
jgi:hypothetical protein